MSQIAVYNSGGEKIKDLDVQDLVFNVAVKEEVVHQVYTALRANSRVQWAHVKDKGDVRGGGRKPWKQKGTGRARHGSIRSPLWRGGGVTFGPASDRNYGQKINKKMNQLAVRMCLSDKVQHDTVLAVDGLEADKTKKFVDMRKHLPGAGKSTLLIVAGARETLRRVVRNVPHITTVRAIDVNVVDLLHHQYIITDEAGLRVLEKRLQKA